MSKLLDLLEILDMRIDGFFQDWENYFRGDGPFPQNWGL